MDEKHSVYGQTSSTLILCIAYTAVIFKILNKTENEMI